MQTLHGGSLQLLSLYCSYLFSHLVKSVSLNFSKMIVHIYYGNNCTMEVILLW